MSILFKRKNLSLITNIIMVLLVGIVAAVCFVPSGAVPASNTSPYYGGSKEGDTVCLMFNVYEGADVVNGILDLLSERGVKATFFMGGCFADDNEELLKRIATEGHELGNHGYFHLDHSKISKQKNREEIENTGRIINALCGYKTTLFAPPSGAFGKDTLSVAKSLGYEVVMWTKDTIDWRDKDEAVIFKRATEKAEAGDFILMHPKAHTLRALPKILDHYAEAGLTPVTVSANLFGG